MDITITIPDEVMQRVLDAFAGSYGYQATIDDGQGNQIPNPQSEAAFSKAQIRAYIKDVVRGYEARDAAETARVAAIAAVDADIELS